MWIRVFGADPAGHPTPEELMECLARSGAIPHGRFTADERGWFRAELSIGSEAPALEIDCYDSEEEGVRNELNAWAAWLETCDAFSAHADLMHAVIGTRRLYVMQARDENAAVCERARGLARYIAGRTAGVCQMDGVGFFASDAVLLVKEDAACRP